jgi:hypothetical protein
MTFYVCFACLCGRSTFRWVLLDYSCRLLLLGKATALTSWLAMPPLALIVAAAATARGLGRAAQHVRLFPEHGRGWQAPPPPSRPSAFATAARGVAPPSREPLAVYHSSKHGLMIETVRPTSCWQQLAQRQLT